MINKSMQKGKSALPCPTMLSFSPSFSLGSGGLESVNRFNGNHILDESKLPRRGYTTKPRVAALRLPWEKIATPTNRNAVASLGFQPSQPRCG
jgi:hypothetical protein